MDLYYLFFVGSTFFFFLQIIVYLSDVRRETVGYPENHENVRGDQERFNTLGKHIGDVSYIKPIPIYLYVYVLKRCVRVISRCADRSSAARARV